MNILTLETLWLMIRERFIMADLDELEAISEQHWQISPAIAPQIASERFKGFWSRFYRKLNEIARSGDFLPDHLTSLYQLYAEHSSEQGGTDSSPVDILLNHINDLVPSRTDYRSELAQILEIVSLSGRLMQQTMSLGLLVAVEEQDFEAFTIEHLESHKRLDPACMSDEEQQILIQEHQSYYTTVPFEAEHVPSLTGRWKIYHSPRPVALTG